MIDIIVFETPYEQTKGLQYRKEIEDDTLFVFPEVLEGTLFHSRNVQEPFEIAFITRDQYILEVWTIFPQEHTIRAPKGTSMAVESKVGVMPRWGFMPGVNISF